MSAINSLDCLNIGGITIRRQPASIRKKLPDTRVIDNALANLGLVDLIGIILSKKLTNNDGTSSIQIEVHDQDKKLTFKLKNKRQIDRKSVNLIKNKDISVLIN